MHNPNADYKHAERKPGLDPALDPDFDWMPWIFDAVRVGEHERRAGQIRRWLEDAGFVDVQVRRTPERGPSCWQAVMGRGTNRRCPTGLAAQQYMHELAADLGCRIEDGESSGLAWGDSIGVGFKLREV